MACFHPIDGENVFEFGGSYIGTIINYIKNYKKSESRVLDESEFLYYSVILCFDHFSHTYFV